MADSRAIEQSFQLLLFDLDPWIVMKWNHILQISFTGSLFIMVFICDFLVIDKSYGGLPLSKLQFTTIYNPHTCNTTGFLLLLFCFVFAFKFSSLIYYYVCCSHFHCIPFINIEKLRMGLITNPFSFDESDCNATYSHSYIATYIPT